MSTQFIDNCILKLTSKLSVQDLKTVKMVLDAEAANFDITPRTTDLTVSFEHYPECVKTYLATRFIEGMSTKSVQLYELTLRKFFEAVRKPENNITANDVRLYLYNYKEFRKVSNRTLDTMRTIISTFFAWANTEGYIDTNPCKNVKPIKYEEKPRKSLTEYELEEVRSACTDAREKAILELFYSTGCRVSEVIGIKRSDVDFAEKRITVKGKGNKTRNVYINAKAELAIKEYLAFRTDDNEFLIVGERKPYKQLTKSGMERIVKQLGEKAKLDHPLFCHLIRHTTATLGLKHGMDVTQVQKMLGHVNIATTMIYAEVSDDAVKASCLKAIV